ncbi:MAG: ATP-binding protein [Deltaproteobacteria bacterium]|nr:ATP-binding protein [Deltaproteobacteria bacterium]MBW2050619.1 ATP-binding protein [Deltaproteobacteria bacterium]MBW2139487.1 ATP-binding protein [Deltaproteobacteria bacterium]MBW2322564.1 ATP-binding protein [Deltaproteobacteria bacterium]
MLELSLHILDVVENALNAGASLIEIELEKDTARDILRLKISDNGSGIPKEMLSRVTDPFYTTRTTRRVGLGLSLLSQAAEQTGGSFKIDSVHGSGTKLVAEFGLSHIDRAPLGDMLGTLMSLIVGRPEVDIMYTQKIGSNEFVLDTREIKDELEGVSLSNPEVIKFLRKNLQEGLAELGSI